MGSFRNKVFIAIVMCFLFLGIGHRVADTFVYSVNIPVRSNLEGRNLQTKPEITVDSVSSGKFQKEAEKFIADGFPKRNGVMLANASVQMSLIKIANYPFGFDVYPTFFGSSYYYCPSQNAIMQTPFKVSSDSVSRSRTSLLRLSDLMTKRNDINWSFYLVERSSISSISPASQLSSDVADYSVMRELTIAALPESCYVYDASIDNLDDYYTDYFTSDHHLTIQGAVRAYEDICVYYGKVPVAISGYAEACPQDFYGSGARNGLCLDSKDVIFDVNYERTPDLSVKIDNSKKSIESLDKGFSSEGYQKTEKFENVYTNYFHGDYGLIEITNEHASGSILIIGDSFTDTCERLFAENYGKVYVIDPRRYKGTIDEFLDSHPVNDALYFGSVETLVNNATSKALVV